LKPKGQKTTKILEIHYNPVKWDFQGTWKNVPFTSPATWLNPVLNIFVCFVFVFIRTLAVYYRLRDL